ncbi:MAG: ABC transporter permease [Saprospiraceae bacterium]
MLKQNLKIGFRNLIKNKTYSFIKIGGFAIGIATFLLVSMFVIDELSVDQHYTEQDRIFRVLQVSTNPDYQFKKWTNFSAPIAKVLKEEYPEVEEAGRLIIRDWYLAGDNQFRSTEKKQNNYEEGFVYADPELLDILEMPMLFGNREDALANPFSIVLSKKKAEQYFPGKNPIGKTVILNENEEQAYTIGGVMDELPSSSWNYDFLITLKGVEFWGNEQNDWCCNNYEAFVKVKPGTDIKKLEEKLIGIRDDYMIRYHEETENPYAEVLKKHRSLSLQAIGDIYLKSNDLIDDQKHGDIRTVRLFGAISFFILLLACINFINLFTAKSANRAKEVGVRKVVGSFRSDLIRQFLTESILYSMISMALGTALVIAALPYFNQLTDKNLSIPFQVWWIIPGLLGLALVIGVLAGTYPSFYLSSFKPIRVLKGNLSRGSKNSTLRNTMVSFQFGISIILLVCAFIVNHQMQFILNTEVGFDKENVLLIHGAGTLEDRTDVFKSEIAKLSMVESVTNSSYFPIDGTNRNGSQFWIEGRQKIDQGVGAQNWWVVENYIPSMKIEILQGRNFSKEIAGDTSSVIINKMMAQELGLEDPIGAQIRSWRTWNVIGVVEDFHYENIKQEIRPLAFLRGSGSAAIVAVRINANESASALTEVTKIWEQFLPNQPIRYSFMSEDYAGMYSDVKRTKRVFASCAILAIVIACLGLFGLSTFMAEQRSKEISIRKILGASSRSLFNLLTSNYMKLLFISALVSIPISWYLMKNWLEGYSYRVDIAWWVFLMASGIVAIIALLTVSRQATKLTFSNPSKFLKSD